ncbi:MAG: hypothetical protein ACPL2D_05570 [Ignavibacteria bacterium]
MNNNNNNTEQLYTLLLDYIEGNLVNEGEVRNIKQRLETDPDFRRTYNELISSRKLLEKIEFKEPDEVYFATFLPKVRDRLEQRKSHKQSISLLKYWQVLIPALTVILVIFLLKVPRSPENIYIPHTDTNIIAQDTSSDNNEKTSTTDIPTEKTNPKPVRTGNEIILEKKSNTITTPLETSLEENELDENNFQNILYEEIEEELMIEKEFEKLSPEKQEIILNKIKEIQL